MPYYQFYGVHHGAGAMFIMLPFLINLLLIFPLLLIGYFVYKKLRSHEANGNSARSIEEPEETLKRRFAEGKMSKEDFEERMATLLSYDHRLS